MSWCRAQSGTFDQRFFFFTKLPSCLFGVPSLTRGRVCHVSVFVIEVYNSQSLFTTNIYVKLKIYTCCTHLQYNTKFTIYTGLVQSRLGTADYVLVTSSLHYNDSLDTRTVIHMTAAKFEPLIFSVSGLALSRETNIFMILHDFCLLPARFCYVIIYVRRYGHSEMPSEYLNSCPE
jgi:hypothetical protein